MAAANVASFGAGTTRHWEDERDELVRFARLAIQTSSSTASGLPQRQPGFLADRLIALDRRYRHLQAGGWRTLSATLPGLETFDQWKPDAPRERIDKPGRWVKYEAPSKAPDGGGLLLPNVPERCWRLICERQGLTFPEDPETIAAGFWPWALQTRGLELLICEGWKKALSALSAGWPAVAVPGVQMGHRGTAETGRRLIAALQALTCPGRRWCIAFDAERRPSTARKVAAAAGALRQTLRAAGGRVTIARLPLLPGTDKTGLDDLLSAAGPEALDRALADTAPRAVLPPAPAPDLIAPAGYLGEVCPLPGPEAAPLLIVGTPMGSGKTIALREALAPLLAAGVPVLMPSHREALGQAGAETIGLPWAPAPGDDQRRLGLACCWDSFCPDSRLRINPEGWSGGVLNLDEWMQAIEHLVMSNGTALGSRRASVLATAGEVIARVRQTIALDAQVATWAVQLLERLTGRRAFVIASEARPMAGRRLHCPQGFGTPKEAAAAFRAKWAELVEAGAPFLCWVTAQRGRFRNAAQNLAKLHRQRVPGARVLVVDSTTKEAAARLAENPDGEAENWDAIYCTPAVSSGISFERWKPAAVLAYAGGRIAPEHVAQAAARVRCPEVPVWIYAPERCPGAALRVGSGANDPAQLIADLRAVSDPLLGQLQTAGDPWLQAWGELGALRNRQRHAYRATIAGLLEREAWALQDDDCSHCTATAEAVGIELGTIATAAKEADDLALLEAEPLTADEARTLATARRRLDPEEAAALGRHQLIERWGLGTAAPSLALLEADRDGLRERLQLGWLLSDPEAAALVPEHDWQQIEALAPDGQAFGPDRLRVALAPKLAALIALGVAALIERFRNGETIAANDPAILKLHATATAHRRQLAAATGISPGAKATGTLRALLRAVGWQLEQAGRIKARGDARDAYTYRAQPVALPEGVDSEALAAVWRQQLQPSPTTGAFFSPKEKPCRGEKSPTPPPTAPPPRNRPRWLALIEALKPSSPPRHRHPLPVPIAA